MKLVVHRPRGAPIPQRATGRNVHFGMIMYLRITMSPFKHIIVQYPYMSNRFYEIVHAWLLAKNSSKHDNIIRQKKLELFNNINGTVLEIGPGTGINIHYFPDSINYIGIEPNRAMLTYLQKEIKQKGFSKYQIINSDAENLTIPDNSIDFVVSTYVLCSVKNINNVISEIKRILKPNGVFLFIEHIIAEKNTDLRKRQHLLKKLWDMIGNGCDLERDTLSFIKQVGFNKVEVINLNVSTISILSPHIIGKATK